MSAQTTRLLQALQHFQERTKGEDLPKGTAEALEGLQKVLGQQTPSRDTPGARAAHEAAPGQMPWVPMEQGARGPDKPSPGQRASESVSEAINKAAAEIASAHN